MKQFKWTISLILVIALFLVGCGAGDEESGKASTGDKEKKAGERLNLLHHLEDTTPLLDVDHEHFPYTDVNGFNAELMTYIDEEIAIANANPNSLTGTAIAWKTGEAIWDEDVVAFVDGYSENAVVDGELYYNWEDEYKKVSLDTDPKKNKEEDVDELEYKIFSSEFFYGDQSYVIEKDGEDNVVVAYDTETLEELWRLEPVSYTKLNGYVKEEGDYVLVNSDAFEYHVLDKETGEVLFEDDIFYSDGILVDDKIYLVNGVGGSSVSYTFHVLDTNTWEVEEILEFEGSPYNHDTREYLEYNDGVLSFHLDQGVIGADVEEKDPFMDFMHFNEEESIETLGYGYVDTIVRDGKFYILSSHEDTDPHGLLSIMDIKSGEVLEQYEINDFQIPRPDYALKVFEQINDDQFIINTEDDGIYLFDFASFE